MDKTRIDLNIVLPEAPDEKDECIKRVISALEYKRGIEKIHLIPANGSDSSLLCFHYDPTEISIGEVETLASEAGADITGQYGHLLLTVTGIRHARHARLLEEQINGIEGVQNASASVTGYIQLEYKKEETTVPKIVEAVQELGLTVKQIQDFTTSARPQVAKKEDADKQVPEVTGAVGCCSHDHHHGGVFGEKTELIFAIISGVFLAAAFTLSRLNAVPAIAGIALYVISYFFGGFYTTKEAIQSLKKAHFEIDFLMLVAAIGAAILGHWAEGALLLFLFSLGHSLEHFAMDKAKKSIAALADLTPKTALRKQGTDIMEVPVAELLKGDTILVKPNSRISADGFVVQGTSSVDQSSITGESIPADKVAVFSELQNTADAEKLDEKHKVFAGTINGSGTLEIKVSRLAADSTIARLITLVKEAQTQKSSTQNFTNKIEKYYVPAVLILVFLLLFAFLVLNEPFGASFYRAMAVLVAASPCALAISTPSAVLSGVARAARSGVLIKGGKPLEQLGSVTAIAFDKTGTLTEGKPTLTGVFPLNNFPQDELLRVVVAAEKLSDHPLAAAIVRGGEQQLGKEIPAAAEVEALQGRGIKARVGGDWIFIGNKELFLERELHVGEDIRKLITEKESGGNTTMLVQKNGIFIGVITLMDTARKEAQNALQALKKVGIQKMIMLTGDNQTVATAVAQQLGIEEARGNLLPAQKVNAIEDLKQEHSHIAMIGDGVNDAPAMAKSSVGIAMGAAGSDVALETADIALMADNLGKLPFAIGLSKKAKRIIKQNLVISLGMVAVLVPLTISGIAKIGPAVVGHEGSTLVVVFNALRLLGYKNRA